MLVQPLPVDPLIKYLATVTGRDKAYRTLQYFARFFTWYLTRKGYSSDLIARWSALKSTLGTSRKLLRVGKPIEHIQALIKCQNIRDDAIRLLAMGKSTSYAIYLWNDMLSWASSTKVLHIQNIKSVQENAARFWLLGIFFSWLSGIYQMRQIAQRYAIVRRTLKAKGVEPAPEDVKKEVGVLRKERQSVVRGLIQDSLDIMIPASTLKYINVEEGFIGLIGVVTGLMGAEAQWRKVNGPK